MLINETSIITQVFLNYTAYVFGSNIITCLVLFLFLFIIGLLIKIPLAFNLALFIPLSIVLMAIGFLPIYAGATLIVILMVLTGVSFVNSL